MNTNTVKKLLYALETLERDGKLFSGKPVRSHLSMIAKIVVKNLIKEIGADKADFIHKKDETCVNSIDKLKNLSREFLALIDGDARKHRK